MSLKLGLAVIAALLLALGVLCLARDGRTDAPATEAAVSGPRAAQAPEPVERESSTTGSARQSLPESETPDDELLAADGAAGPELAELEIRVLRGEEVAHDARAWLVAGYHRELPADLRTPPPGYEPVFAGADAAGVLRFPGLAPGSYRVAIELGELRLEQGIRVVAHRALAPIVIRLGAALVEGFVFDAEGAPAASALVRLCRRGYGRNPPPFECFARTDANGFYRFVRVPPGPQVVEAHPEGTLQTSGAERECVVPIEGKVRVDFGAPEHEGVLWTGVARNGAGAPVPGPGEIRVHDELQDEFRTQALRADGSFELRLRPGKHHVWLQPAGFFPRQVDLGLVDVPAGGLQRDMVVPGARLRLRLTLPPDWDGEPSPAVRAKSESQSFLQLVRLADESWVHDGLAPGEYVLSAGPLQFAENHGPEYSFSLPPGAGELTLDLRLEPR